ncbi:MAG: WYL domain-containing protein [Candidatus Rokuibacteriota bacterium]
MPRGGQLARQWRLVQFLDRPGGLEGPRRLQDLPAREAHAVGAGGPAHEPPARGSAGRQRARRRRQRGLLRRWILGYGVQAEVVEPLALREALWREAQAMAEALRPGRKPLAAVAAHAVKGTATR